MGVLESFVFLRIVSSHEAGWFTEFVSRPSTLSMGLRCCETRSERGIERTAGRVRERHK